MSRARPIPVFVGNISFDVSEAMVRDLFSTVGPVLAVRFVQDKETGKTKGYGFVEFGDSALAEAAVRALNGRELGGRALRVDFAEHPDGTRVVVGQRRGARRNAAAQCAFPQRVTHIFWALSLVRSPDARPGAPTVTTPAWTGGIAVRDSRLLFPRCCPHPCCCCADSTLTVTAKHNAAVWCACCASGDVVNSSSFRLAVNATRCWWCCSCCSC